MCVSRLKFAVFYIILAFTKTIWDIRKPVGSIRSRFDTSSSSEITQKILITSSVVCASTRMTFWILRSLNKYVEWNYWQIDWINLYRNDLHRDVQVSKRPVNETSLPVFSLPIQRAMPEMLHRVRFLSGPSRQLRCKRQFLNLSCNLLLRRLLCYWCQRSSKAILHIPCRLGGLLQTPLLFLNCLKRSQENQNIYKGKHLLVTSERRIGHIEKANTIRTELSI